MVRLAKKRTQDFTVWTLKPGHLEEDRPITTFSEDKKILNFFCKRIYQTSRFNHANVENFKTI